MYPQTAEGLFGNTGSPGRDHRGLLEDAVGAQLHHRRHAHQATRDGTGNNTPSKPLWECVQHSEGHWTTSENRSNVLQFSWFR